MDQVSNLLCSILGVVGLVQQLSILSGLARRHLVKVHPFVPKLGQELCHKYNGCDVPSWNQAC